MNNLDGAKSRLSKDKKELKILQKRIQHLRTRISEREERMQKLVAEAEADWLAQYSAFCD